MVNVFGPGLRSRMLLHMSALRQKRTYAPQKAMSALPPKADMCGALADVRFGPKADIAPPHSIISSARACIDGGTLMPSALRIAGWARAP